VLDIILVKQLAVPIFLVDGRMMGHWMIKPKWLVTLNGGHDVTVGHKQDSKDYKAIYSTL